MFGEFFETWADRPFVRDDQRTLRYSEVLALGRRLTSGLPRPRSLVVLRCGLTIEAVAAYVALLCDGHVPLLLEDGLSEQLAAQLVTRYRPDAIVDPARGEVTIVGEEPVDLNPALALLLTTSGSTGSPKLVRLSADGVRSNAEAIAACLALTPDERALLHLPMSYSYGMSIINSHLVAGACICLTRSSVMEPGYWEDLKAFEATSISGVPFHYGALRRFGEARLELPHLTSLTQAGGRLDPKLGLWFAEWAARTGRRFFIMYGQTEAGPRIACLPPGAATTAPDAVGVAIPGVTIALCDEHGQPVADGEAGEMVVHSRGVMMGYALDPDDLALADMMGGVLATGDVAMRGADGFLRIVGRRSRMLKIYGLRVNIDEIEVRLAGDGVSVLCFGEDDKLRVLIEPGSAADAGTVRQAILALFSLPPRGIEVRKATAPVARTAAGKLSAATLAEAWAAAVGQPGNEA